ncbi:response regulator [Methylobacterium sp. Leaf108]|uniref:response regulator n=1 Tax=Methylobacterium sp. Leaf108 TaxID=1736256 RepID=UPI0006F3BCC3|nr:response regulator [Methylobacterium sp. Leaf108]KQP51980.1 response regulator receiver protein [Methylobacterium sp. Leaf108]
MDRKPVVLVVEDNYILLDLLSTLCERQGITATAVSSGEDAMAFLRGNPGEVDWLFTDINLPGLIDGWVVAEAYRALNPGRPVIYTSASRLPERSAVAGSVFLRKPFRVNDLVELVRMMAAPPRRALRAAG